MQQVSWIPEKFATIGRIVDLKENAGWAKGWKIASVGGKMLFSEINKRRNDYKTQRQGSDI